MYSVNGVKVGLNTGLRPTTCVSKGFTLRGFMLLEGGVGVLGDISRRRLRIQTTQTFLGRLLMHMYLDSSKVLYEVSQSLRASTHS